MFSCYPLKKKLTVYAVCILMPRLLLCCQQLDDKSEFHKEFLGFFKHALIIFKREPAVERTLDFVAKFAASFASMENSSEETEEEQPQTPDNNFMIFLFSFLLKVCRTFKTCKKLRTANYMWFNISNIKMSICDSL